MKSGRDNNISFIYKYLKGECSPHELQTVFNLFESPYKNLNLRKTIYEWWNSEKELQSQPELENPSGILDKIHHQINLSKQQPQKNTKTLIIKNAKIAAVLLIGLVTGLLITHYNKNEPIYYTSVAPNGSISMVILPDSSVVYLNSGSKIDYSISGPHGNREVFLNGEAWFNIAENYKKPFTVSTTSYKIKVTGTKFNVKAYKSESKVITTLEEGSVQVLSSSNPDFNNKMLKPGEQFIYDKTKNNFEVAQVSARLFTSWKDNKLIFINMNLRELIVLLERKYGVDITVSDNIVLNYHYDGTIKSETILEVLELLKETLPINYKIEGQQVIIQKK